MALGPAEADPDNAPAGVGDRVPDGQLGRLQRIVAGNVRGQRDGDAISLPSFLGAVAVSGEDFLPADTAPGRLRRRKNPFNINGPVRGGLGRVA